MRQLIVLTLICGSALAADSAAVQHCQVMAAQRIAALRASSAIWHSRLAVVDSTAIAQRCAADPVWYEALPQPAKRTHCDSTVSGTDVSTDCVSQ